MSATQPQPILNTVAIRGTEGQDRVLAPAPRRQGRQIVVVGLLLAAVALIAVAWPAYRDFAASDKSVARARLRLATVTRKDFVRDLAVSGRVVAAVKPTIYAPAVGIVTLRVAAGDAVNAGDVLAEIESPELASELAQQRSMLQRMESALARQRIDRRKQEAKNQQIADLAAVALVAAERELRRAEKSWQQGIISEQVYERAQDEVAKARVGSDHAKQNAGLESDSLAFELQSMELDRQRQRLVVSELERRVEQLRLVSPVSGIVGDLAVEQRAAVGRDQPLMSVVDLSAFQIEAQVPQEYADDLTPGMAAQVSVGSDAYAVAIASVSPEVSDNQVRARLRFADAVPEGLRQNQRVSARVLLASVDNTLTVQRGPFVDSGGGRIAYVVDGDLAVRRSIRTGATSIGEVEITEGLAEGEQIVISDIGQFEGAETVLLTD